MLCYLDRAFCSDANACKNKALCPRWFSPEEELKASQWMLNPPVAFMPFKETCIHYAEVQKSECQRNCHENQNE